MSETDYSEMGFPAMLEGLVAFLQDPSRVDSSFCTVCMLSEFPGLHQGVPGVEHLMENSQGLWNTCMRELFALRTSEEEDELRRYLVRDIDSCLRRASHKTVVEDHLLLFNTMLCVLLCVRIYGLEGSTGRSGFRGVPRPRQPLPRFDTSNILWPSDPEQLFPYGPTQTVGALVKACETVDDDSPWWILCAVLRLARPRVSSCLFHDRTTRIHLGSAILAVAFHGTRYNFRLCDQGSPPQVLEPRNLDVPWILLGRGRRCITALLEALNHTHRAHPDDMYHFCSVDMPTYGVAYDAAHQLSQSTRLPEWYRIAVTLVCAAPDMQEAREKYPDPDILTIVEQRPRRGAVIMAIEHSIRALSGFSCCRPQCPSAMLDDRAKKICGRCKCAKYCSRECQTTDWAREHKRFCALIAEFEAAKANAQGPSIAAPVQHSSISDERLVLLGRWAVASTQENRDLIRSALLVPGFLEPPSGGG